MYNGNVFIHFFRRGRRLLSWRWGWSAWVYNGNIFIHFFRGGRRLLSWRWGWSAWMYNGYVFIHFFKRSRLHLSWRRGWSAWMYNGYVFIHFFNRSSLLLSWRRGCGYNKSNRALSKYTIINLSVIAIIYSKQVHLVASSPGSTHSPPTYHKLVVMYLDVQWERLLLHSLLQTGEIALELETGVEL